MIKSNLVLIGMPGCGKSTSGVLAAKALCKQFIDTDLLIQAQEGSDLQSILNTKGPDYFADVESGVLTDLEEKNCIIATGGSAVYHEDAMKHLKEHGIVIYLQISLDVMLHRIRNITTRGILLHDGETIQDMYASRESLYERYADITIDCNGLSAEQTVEAICTSYRNI